MGLLGWIGGFLARQRPSQTVLIVRDRPIRARYDLAQTTNDNKNHWAAADSYDADSANSAAVRSITVRRSRYETENNGYAKGMLRTMANYTVGRGPKLRLQTRSAGFNAMVQAAWNRWAKRVKLGRKLRTAVKARCRDGEAFLVAKINDNLRDPVKLDLVGVECEQVTSTDLLFAEKNRVDGVRFDDFGNPVAYDILPYHPGGQWWPTSTKAERVDAKFVFHLFQEERPRQHRAIPECSSTLPTCAQSRRWREATLQAAENLADFSLFLKSQDTANTEADFTVPPLATLEIEKGLMVNLPDGKEPFQPKAEQPAATYEGFLRAQVGEQSRPLSMSYSLAACDSSNANFASAKLDQHPFQFQVDVDQADAEDLVLDPLFELWFPEAVRVYGWAWENPDEPPAHAWDWPAMPIVDEVDTANARETNIRTGVGSVRRYLTEDGYDPEEELQKEAEYYGVSVDEVREARFAAVFKQGAGQQQPSNGTSADDSTSRNRTANRLPPSRNGTASNNGNGRARAGT